MDSYLAISQIANDDHMNERVRAAATQQQHLGNTPLIDDAVRWAGDNMYLWAASPGWGEAWTYALTVHADDPDYEPGADESVITDGMILATVQELGSE
jgi:hypothetical protein